MRARASGDDDSANDQGDFKGAIVQEQQERPHERDRRHAQADDSGQASPQGAIPTRDQSDTSQCEDGKAFREVLENHDHGENEGGEADEQGTDSRNPSPSS